MCLGILYELVGVCGLPSVMAGLQKSDGVIVTIAQRFQSACLDVAEPEFVAVELLPTLLVRACAKVMGVAGSGISVFTDEFRVSLGASDRDADIAEQLQFTLGEGPCLYAYRNAEPFRGDEERLRQKWPLFHNELVSRTPYRSIVSMPFQLSRSTGGALDLYQHEPDGTDAVSLKDLAVVVGLIVDALSWRTPLETDYLPTSLMRSPSAKRRTKTWIAIGMLNYAYDLSARDALARLRAYAYAHDQALDDVTERLVGRTLPLASLQP
jgi:hypothetical protein